MLWYVVLGLFCAWLYSNRITSASKQDRAAGAALRSSGRDVDIASSARTSARQTFDVSDDRLSPHEGAWRRTEQQRKGSTGSYGYAGSDERPDSGAPRAQSVHPDRLGLVQHYAGDGVSTALRQSAIGQATEARRSSRHRDRTDPIAALTVIRLSRTRARLPSTTSISTLQRTRLGPRAMAVPRCSICSRNFPREAALRQHNIDKHFSNIALTGSVWHGLPPPEHGGPMPVKCEVCHRESANAFFLLQHQAHKHPWAVLCVDCKISFSSVDEAREHYANVHSETRYLRRETVSHEPSITAQRRGPAVGRRSPVADREVDLRFHLPYRCHMCDERFASAMDREEHLSSPFGHGGSTAVEAAFPPLSASTGFDNARDTRSSRSPSSQGTAMSRSSTASSRSDRSAERRASLLQALAVNPDDGATPAYRDEAAITPADEGDPEQEVFAELIDEPESAAPVTVSRDEEEQDPINAIAESHEKGIDLNQPLPVFTLTPSTSADGLAIDTPVTGASPVSFEENDWAVPDWTAEEMASAADTADTSISSETSNCMWSDARGAVLDAVDKSGDISVEEEDVPMLMLGERAPIPVPGPEFFPPLPSSPVAVKLDTPQSSPEKAGSGRWQDGSRIDFTPPVDSSHPSRRHLFRREPSEPDSDEDFPPSMRRDRPPSNIYTAVNDMCSPVSGSNSIPIGKRRSPANRYRIENTSAPQSALGLPARHATTPRFSGSSAHDTRPPNAHVQPSSARGWQHPAVIEPYQKHDQHLAVDHAATAWPLGDDQATIQEQVPCFSMQGDSAIPYNAMPDPPAGPPGPRPVPVHGSSARWSTPPPVRHPQPARASERWTARGYSSGPAYDPSNPRSWGSNSPTPSLDTNDTPAWRVRSASGQRSSSGSPARPSDDRSHVAHLYGQQESYPRQRKISTTSASTSSGAAAARSTKNPTRSRHTLEPQFAESEWQSVAPVAPTRKSRGGRAQTAAPVRVKETFAQKQMRQAELVWSGQPEPLAATVVDDADDPYGGW